MTAFTTEPSLVDRASRIAFMRAHLRPRTGSARKPAALVLRPALTTI
jgi:hypothetical protein